MSSSKQVYLGNPLNMQPNGRDCGTDCLSLSTPAPLDMEMPNTDSLAGSLEVYICCSCIHQTFAYRVCTAWSADMAVLQITSTASQYYHTTDTRRAELGGIYGLP